MPDSCGIPGTIYISFIVSKTGEVKDLHVKAGGCTMLEQHIEKQLEDIPTWKPGRQDGKPVDVQMILPVKIHPK